MPRTAESSIFCGRYAQQALEDARIATNNVRTYLDRLPGTAHALHLPTKW